MAMTPIGPAPVMSTSSPNTGKESAVVNSVSKGIEDRGHLQISARVMPPNVGHRKRD